MVAAEWDWGGEEREASDTGVATREEGPGGG